MRPKYRPTKEPASKRRKIAVPEEILFDPSDRKEYLTGFHKRKLQRTKHAQEVAAKREREEKVAARKALREERKANLEQQLKAAEAIYRPVLNHSDDTDQSSEEWEGIQDVHDYKDDLEEEGEEEGVTTVTVESVEITKDGMETVKKEYSDEDAENKERPVTIEAPSKRTGDRPLKKRKKKFRYESKEERKLTRLREKRSSQRARSRRK